MQIQRLLNFYLLLIKKTSLEDFQWKLQRLNYSREKKLFDSQTIDNSGDIIN